MRMKREIKMFMKGVWTAAFFLVGATISHAQVYGCTDVMANNYNASATVNDGTCAYSTASVTPVSSVNLNSTISETSGLVKWGDYLWTHNDNTDTNIYALDTANGNIAQTYPLLGLTNIDWEEIAQDSTYFYIGDLGNNAHGNRTNLKIYRVHKDSLLNAAPLIDTISFAYSNQTDFSSQSSNNTDFDCEAFIVTSDSIYLFTKQWVSKKTSLYALAKTPGTHVATLQSTLDVQGLITGATVVEDKKIVVLCGYTNTLQPFMYLLYDYSGSDFFSGNKRKLNVSLSFHQTEAVATTDGINYFVSNEYFTQPPYITIEQQLHTFNLMSYLGNYLNGTTTGIVEQKYQNQFSVFPNPATDVITIVCNAGVENTAYTLYNVLGESVVTGSLNANSTSLQIDEIQAGVYILNLKNDTGASMKMLVIKN